MASKAPRGDLARKLGGGRRKGPADSVSWVAADSSLYAYTAVLLLEFLLFEAFALFRHILAR
eukprot:9495825-Pyramimonas_sp.AAC.1